MISSTRLVLALAAMGLAAPAVGDDGAMAVLASNQLDALTASAMPPAARSGGAASAVSGLSFDASDHARDVAPKLVSGLVTPQARAAGQGSGSSQNGSAGAPSSAAGGPGEMSAAAGSVLGGSFGRSVSALLTTPSAPPRRWPQVPVCHPSALQRNRRPASPAPPAGPRRSRRVSQGASTGSRA